VALPLPAASAGDLAFAFAFERLVALLAGRRFVALTGAGCSTESGIPDYRSPAQAARPRSPILHDAFVRRPEVRQRYWARATLGWLRFSGAAPNPAHRALAALEQAGRLVGLITQNVDRLHHAAGSRRTVELHGALAEVRCLACGDREPRADVHARLLAANPGWLDQAIAVAPDGDAELPADQVTSFRVVDCRGCAGPLTPDVVFFGGTVPAHTVAVAHDMIDRAEALLIVGSSLAVYSGFRFVRRAAERGLGIGVVNLGPTRADDLCTVKLEARAGEALSRLAERLI
jgi:NAD+-dependent protein deacetylase sirtuin 4